MSSNKLKQFTNEKKNYLSGFCGALIGGIICTIPWILVQAFSNRIAPVLALFIGLGSYKTYTFFKGKLGPLTKWIVALCAVISVFLAQAGTIITVLIQSNIPVTYTNWGILMQQPDFIKLLRSNILLGTLMAFLGILPLLLQPKGNAKGLTSILLDDVAFRKLHGG